MEPHDQMQEPEIYMPTEAATATAPDGKKMVFFTVPQLELMIKHVISARPTEYSYRWGYHPGHKVHVLLFGWPTGQGAGIAIPEGTGDMVLNFMLGTSDLYITTEPVQERLQGNVSAEEIDKIRFGNTAYLPGVKFKPETGG
ncbi:MAG: hypothetical protein ACOY94_21380 [Bacillota bacterium]